ncbi:MAG: PQQ-binding-like beta-propeller repeat protein [Limisphaerales bacterium]
MHSSSRLRPATFVLALGLLTTPLGLAVDWPQWRGPQRNGVSAETGLLQQWPEGGPPLRWHVSNLGSGYGAPSVVGDRLYVLDNEGLENESVRALSAVDGQTLWSTRLGKVGNPEQKPTFPAARSTPTVVGDALYALGSDGDLACVEAATGKVWWRKNLRADFAGKPGVWAYAESPLVDGDVVICTPGGAEATVVALNRKTGDVLWKAALPEADEAGYASAIVVEAAGVRQYVQLLQKGLVGLDVKTGRLLWRFAKTTSRYNANIPSPLFADGIVYAGSAGTGGGAVRLKAGANGVEAEELYFESKLPTAIGGAVKVGDFLYGTTAQAMLCSDFVTGQIKWEERALGAASIVVADNRLYLHGENGEVGLIEPSAEGYLEKSRFSPPNRPKRAQPMEKSWAYPVIADARLYLRDHGVLWCYDLKAP